MAAAQCIWARRRGEADLLQVEAASASEGGGGRTEVTLNEANVLDARRAAGLNISQTRDFHHHLLGLPRGRLKTGRLVCRAFKGQRNSDSLSAEQKHVHTHGDFIRFTKVCFRATKCILIICTARPTGLLPECSWLWNDSLQSDWSGELKLKSVAQRAKPP